MICSWTSEKSRAVWPKSTGTYNLDKRNFGVV